MIPPPVVSVRGLTVSDGAGTRVLDDVSLTVGPSERVAVVGASGSGKTTLALALLGTVRRGLRRTAGRVVVDGVDVLDAPRGRTRPIAYLPQEPGSALTPTMRVRAQVLELAVCTRATKLLAKKNKFKSYK